MAYSNEPFDWYKYSRKLTVKMSISQVNTGMGCIRQWWYGSVRKIKGIVYKAHSFGTCLHSVVERYRAADDQGRDMMGKPVDLYPEGWHIAEDRFGGESDAPPLTLEEQATIRTLVQMAEDQGVLRRDPDRTIEEPIYEEMEVEVDDITYTVVLIGAIDYAHSNVIEDTKSSKAVRWLVTEKALPDDPQMLFCAYMKFMYKKPKSEWPKKIELVHNQYVKDPEKPQVREIRVEVSPAKVKNFWDTRFMPHVRRMLQVRHDITEGLAIAPPQSRKVCDKYGGCQFGPICTRTKTEEQLEHDLLTTKKLNSSHNPKAKTETKKVAKSSPMDFLKGAQKKGAPASTSPKAGGGAAKPPAGKIFPPGKGPKKDPIPSTPKTTVKPAASKPEAVDLPLKAMEPQTPWHNENCKACDSESVVTKGLTEQYTPCAICDIHQSNADLPTSSSYVVEVDTSLNMVVWYPRPSDDAGTADADAVDAAKIQAEAQEELEKEQAEADRVQEEADATKLQEEEEATRLQAESDLAAANATTTAAKPEAKAKKTSRKTGKTTTLYIGCCPQKAKTRPTDVYAFYTALRQNLEEHLGESWADMDCFGRKEAIESAVLGMDPEDVVKHGPTFHAALVPNNGEAYTHVVRALRSLVTEVVS